MPGVQRHWTVAEVLALPEDGNRYELIGGRLIVNPAPAPQHQRVITGLLQALSVYLAPLGLRKCLYLSPADISWDDETLVQPDIFVVPPDQVSDSWTTFQTLQLAVEVISPSSARRDRGLKRRLYQRQRVLTYWVVDPEARRVEVWRPGDEEATVIEEVVSWQVTADAPVMRLELNELW